jgi:hypothetical protein
MSPGQRRNRGFRPSRKCRAENKFRATKSGFPGYSPATENQGRTRWLIRTRIPASKIRPPDRNRASSKAAARSPASNSRIRAGRAKNRDSRVKANDRITLVEKCVLKERPRRKGGVFLFDLFLTAALLRCLRRNDWCGSSKVRNHRRGFVLRTFELKPHQTNKIGSVPSLPKFVKRGAAKLYELRKRYTAGHLDPPWNLK